MGRYNRKVDKNQGEIIKAFERLGYSVHDLSACGGGMPDLVVGRRRRSFLIEVKDPAEGSLTAAQERFFEAWEGGAYIVASLADVAAFNAAHFGGRGDEDYPPPPRARCGSCRCLGPPYFGDHPHGWRLLEEGLRCPRCHGGARSKKRERAYPPAPFYCPSCNIGHMLPGGPGVHACPRCRESMIPVP